MLKGIHCPATCVLGMCRKPSMPYFTQSPLHTDFVHTKMQSDSRNKPWASSQVVAGFVHPFVGCPCGAILEPLRILIGLYTLAFLLHETTQVLGKKYSTL